MLFLQFETYRDEHLPVLINAHDISAIRPRDHKKLDESLYIFTKGCDQPLQVRFPFKPLAVFLRRWELDEAEDGTDNDFHGVTMMDEWLRRYEAAKA